MPSMSIIGCQVFEDEIVYLIDNDPDIDQVVVLQNDKSDNLIDKIKEQGYTPDIISSTELDSHSGTNSEQFTLIIDLLGVGLHASQSNLRSTVYSEIEKLEQYSDVILVLYGLCGGALHNIEQDFENLSILKDENGDIVDDCICASLGGKEKYIDVLKKYGKQGTFFLTPVQTVYWKDLVKASKITPDPDDVETTKNAFEYLGYNKVAQINTGLSYEKNYDKKVDDFANKFDFDVIEIEGTSQFITDFYLKIKRELQERS